MLKTTVHVSQSLLVSKNHGLLVSLETSVRSDDRTNRHEQTEGSNRAHNVLAQGSHDTVWSSTMLQNGKASKENTNTDTDGTAHHGAHFELVKVGRLLVVDWHYMNMS